ncbi:DEKNAAC102931 [Brettanomyces naardenensis]|uniref:DEKNAAC102931 n=1 Tax=Brettanomyces naardenensis TaxID=13370 RepID=A0A448YLT7_BRENA|nr:DEKNAAC102931 [Brettanomyces naardenensis]
MTTQIFSDTPLSASQIETISKDNEARELAWLISSIVRPQLPEIKEGLSSCLRQVSEDNEAIFKLPLSSHKSEILKGTVSRKNYKIVGLNVSIKTKGFNSGRPFSLQLKEDQSIIIRQLLDCHDYIYKAVNTIDKIQETEQLDPLVFLKYIEQLYEQIISAKQALNDPNPAYIFPKYRTSAAKYEPEMPECINLDFFVNNSELTVDFQSLKRVTKRPWCTIVNVRGHLSFADYVRVKISKERNRSVHQIIIDEYQRLLRWQKNEEEKDEDEEVPTLGSTLKSIFGTSNDPSLSSLLKSASKYLEQCITYVDNENKPYVVNIVEKCEMVTSDPILLSLSVKLDSLEKAVGRLEGNMRSLAS